MRSVKHLPRNSRLAQFVLFNAGGAAFFVVGYAVFSLLYGMFSWRWWAAKMLGDLCGWTVNYLIQRYAAFREESKSQKEHHILGKFTAISLANVPLDYAIVGGLKWLGVTPFVGLFVSSWFFTIWKYVWYRWWVFTTKR